MSKELLGKTIKEAEAMGFEFSTFVDEEGFDTTEDTGWAWYIAYWGEMILVDNGIVTEVGC